jgi:hypothetical protein
VTVIFQKMIYRADLKRNPTVLYVFGDNLERVGMGGQAGAMRGEPNAVGVATKTSPSRFFKNDTSSVRLQNAAIDADMAPLFAQARAGGVIVWPSDGIGTGLSDLPEFSPRTLAHIEARLAELQAT